MALRRGAGARGQGGAEGGGGGAAAPLSLRPCRGLSAAAAAPPMAPGNAPEGAAGGGAGRPGPARGPAPSAAEPSLPEPRTAVAVLRSSLLTLSLPGGCGESGAGGLPAPGWGMPESRSALPSLPRAARSRRGWAPSPSVAAGWCRGRGGVGGRSQRRWDALAGARLWALRVWVGWRPPAVRRNPLGGLVCRPLAGAPGSAREGCAGRGRREAPRRAPRVGRREPRVKRAGEIPAGLRLPNWFVVLLAVPQP